MNHQVPGMKDYVPPTILPVDQTDHWTESPYPKLASLLDANPHQPFQAKG